MTVRRALCLRPALAVLALAGCQDAPPRIASPPAGARLGGDSLEIAVTSEGTDYVVVFDGQGHGRGPVPLKSVGDGPHRIAVRDAKGQVHDEREIVLDRTPPRLRVNRPAAIAPFGTAPGEALEVDVSVQDASELKAVTADGVALAPGPHHRYSGRVQFKPGATLKFEAVDAVGNVSRAEVTPSPGLIRWQAPMPVEPGAWTAERLSDDAVLLALGEAAVVIGPDGRERWHHETPGHVLVEAHGLPDASVLVRLLHATTPSGSEVRWLSPDGKPTSWNRPDAVPLALAHLGDVPVIAWRAGEQTEIGRAPAPWPPATFSPWIAPFEPLGFVTSGGTLFAVRDAESVALAEGPPGTLTGRVPEAPPPQNTCLDPRSGQALSPQPVWPPDARVSEDHCAAFLGKRVFASNLPATGLDLASPVAGVARVGERTVAVVEGKPPVAVIVKPGAEPERVPLEALDNVIRIVALPDGLLVVGLLAVRPDRALVLRLAVAETPRSETSIPP